MRSKWSGAIAALVATILLVLPLAPASAASWDLTLPAKSEDGLMTQLWQWIASLFGAETAGGAEETSSAGTCTPTGSSRGCAIDPNGSD
jgi:hypothetical protein